MAGLIPVLAAVETRLPVPTLTEHARSLAVRTERGRPTRSPLAGAAEPLLRCAEATALPAVLPIALEAGPAVDEFGDGHRLEAGELAGDVAVQVRPGRLLDKQLEG